MGQLVYGTLYFVLTVSLFVAVRYIIYQKKVIDSLERERKHTTKIRVFNSEELHQMVNERTLDEIKYKSSELGRLK